MWSSSTCRSHGRGCRSRCTTSPGRSGASRSVPPRTTKPPDSVYYERRGRTDGAAPPVLFLHGLGSSAADWAPQLGPFWRALPPPARRSPGPLAVGAPARTADHPGDGRAGRRVARPARHPTPPPRRPLARRPRGARALRLGGRGALGRNTPGGRVELVPDSGHVTNRAQPTIFNRIVLDFLAAH